MKLKKSLVLLALSQLPVFSATFNVSTTLELRQALENAALNGENDTIVLQPGTYSTVSDGLGTFMFNDTEEYNLTIEGADGYSMNDIVLDGESTHQVMNFTNSKPFTLKIKNLSIVNGKSESKGGGFYTTSNTVVEDCNISNNSSDYYTGGFFSDKSAILVNSIISNNTGGTVGGFSSMEAIIKNSVISNNSSIGKGGGFSSTDDTVIINSIIYNNKSNNGGGFFSNGSISIYDSNISNNKAKYTGGGFFSYDLYSCSYYDKKTIIISSTISNNIADLSGGFDSNCPVFMINSIIYNNQARFASSFRSYKNSVLINNNIINNTSKIQAKGIFINNIFVNDGIDFDGDSKLYYNYIDYKNLIEDNYVIVKKSNLQPTVGDIYLADDNITLQSGSPAIDAGLNPTDDLFKNAFDDEETYAKVLEYLKTDYFGNERIVNGKIDLGASEYGATTVSEDKPKISIELSGDQKVYYSITINFNIETPNTISELYVDKGNGYESVATTLRSFTVTYDSAGEHTVKVKAVDDQGNVAEVTKSINVYDLTTQEAIEYGKKLCQKDPASCGISQNSQVQSILDNPKLTDTTTGWRLLGVEKNISVDDILNKNKKISIVWAYKNGTWHAKGANKTINSLIMQNDNISLLDTLESGDGFWINVK